MLCKVPCSRCRLAQIRPTHRSRLNFHKSFFMTCAGLIAHCHVTYNYSAVQDISCFVMEVIFVLRFVSGCHESTYFTFSFSQQLFTLVILQTDIYCINRPALCSSILLCCCLEFLARRILTVAAKDFPLEREGASPENMGHYRYMNA